MNFNEHGDEPLIPFTPATDERKLDFALTDRPKFETDASASDRARTIADTLFDVYTRAKNPVDPDMDDGDARAEATYMSHALTGSDDVYGRIWNGGRPFANGREFLLKMRDFVNRDPDERYSRRYREYMAKDAAGRLAEAMEARSALDRIRRGIGNAAAAVRDAYVENGVPTANPAFYGSAAYATPPDGAKEENDARRERDRKDYERQVLRDYELGLARENAWSDLASILALPDSELSAGAKECVRAVMASEDVRLPETLWAKFNALPDAEKHVVCRTRRIMKADPDGDAVNFLRDLSVGALNVGTAIATAPYRFGNKIGQMAFMSDYGVDVNELSRRRQLLWEATGDFFAGGAGGGHLPQMQLEQTCNRHGFVAEALIGAVSTLPYMGAAALPGIGTPLVAIEAMNEMDDHVALEGGDISDPAYICASAVLGGLYAYTERLQLEGLLGGVGDLEVRTALLKGLWKGTLSKDVVRSTLAGTVAESVQEGLQNGIMEVNEALALDGDATRAFAEGFTSDFVGSLGTMLVVEAGGHVVGHAKRSGYLGGGNNMFTSAGREAGREARSMDVVRLADSMAALQDMVNPEARATSEHMREIHDFYKAWKDGGARALRRRFGLSEGGASEVDGFFKAQREAEGAATAADEAVPRTMGDGGGKTLRAAYGDFLSGRSDVAAFRSSLTALGFTEKGADDYVLFARLEKDVASRGRAVGRLLAGRYDRAHAAGEEKAKSLARVAGAMEDLDPLRRIWAAGRGVLMTDKSGKTVADPGARALEAHGFTKDAAERLSRVFHYERAAARSRVALDGVKALYEARMRGRVDAAAAMRDRFGGRMVRLQNGVDEKGGATFGDYLAFKAKDGSTKLVQIVEDDVAAPDFSDPSPALGKSIADALNANGWAAAHEGRAFDPQADWVDRSPEERGKIWETYNLGEEGLYAPVPHVTMAVPGGSAVDSTQAAELIGRVTVAGRSAGPLKDADGGLTGLQRIVDTSAVFHEIFHAFSDFAKQTGIFDEEDLKNLRERYGNPTVAGESYDEETGAEAFRAYLSRRMEGAASVEDETGPWRKLAAFVFNLKKQGEEKAAREAARRTAEERFYDQIVADAMQRVGSLAEEEKKPAHEAGEPPPPPVVAADPRTTSPAPAAPAAPKTWSAFTPTGNVKVSGHWQVFDLSELVHSNNPLYAQYMRAQLRDRKDNKAEEDTRNEIVNNFQAERLLEAPDTANGAPIVFMAPDEAGTVRPFVLSGNGRVLVLNDLNERHLFDQYRDTMKRWAAANGVRVPDGDTPVLVRVIDDYGGETRDRIADLSNTNSIQQYNEEEQARADAEVVRANNLARLYVANLDGTPNMIGANDEFFAEFVRGVGDTSLYTSDRALTQKAVQRATRALMAIAAGQGARGRDVVKKLVEQTATLGINRQKAAVVMMAAPVAALEGKPEYAIGPDVSRAVADFMDYVERKARGVVGTIGDVLAEGDMFDPRSEIADEILKLLASNRAAATIAEYVKEYCRAAGQEDPAGNLFGAARTRTEIWHAAAKLVDERAAAPDQAAARHSVAVGGRTEYDEVVARYTNPDGTRRAGWMKAPNGRPTNLTERQWVQVRTPSFKKWFGDWESMSELAPSNIPEAKAVFKGLMARNAEIKTEDGVTLRFVSQSAKAFSKEAEKSSSSANAHWCALTNIENLVGRSRFLYEEKPRNGSQDIEAYVKYGAVFSFGGEQYLAKITSKRYTGRDAQNLYSVESVSVEKIAARGIHEAIAKGQPLDADSTQRIADFLGGINPSSVSKVVDENGEPKVVYHGARQAGFSVFDDSEGRKQSDAPDGTSWFSDSREVARSYSGTHDGVREYGEDAFEEGGSGNYACFLNIRNPHFANFEGQSWTGDAYGKFALFDTTETDEWEERVYPDDGRTFFDSREEAEAFAESHGIEGFDVEEDPYLGFSTNSVVRDAMDMGHDGAILENVVDSGSHADPDAATDYVVFSPEQVKSATDNTGAFSQDNPDIRFSIRVNPNLRKELDAARREYDDVVRRYTNPDGTRRAGWMKAPNGRPTNLTERQWVQVRTPSFKKWFGDWEKSGRFTKLRAAAPISLDWDGKYDLNQKSAREWMLANIRDTYENRDTGDRIRVSREGIKKATSHGMYDETHLKSMSIVPQMIRDSIFIDELDATSEDKKYDKYRYYVAGVKIDGEDYTAKVVVGIKNGEAYYDHNLTKIEKGNLIDALNKVDNPVASKISLDAAHDTKLLKILQLPSSVSKVVDENGEPKVVAHSTDADFTVFRDMQINDAGWLGAGFYFFGDRTLDGQYGHNVMNCFLNIRDPYYITEDERSRLVESDDREVSREFSDTLRDDGYDGVYYNGDLNMEYAVFSPEQVKSATDNTGAFSQDNPDIRFSIRVNPNLRKEVEAALAKRSDVDGGRQMKRHAEIVFSEDLPMFEFLGLPSRRVVSDATRIRKLATKHHLDEAQIANLPKRCDSPAAVMRDGEDGYVVLTDMLAETDDGERKPVRVFLRPKTWRSGEVVFLATAMAENGADERAYYEPLVKSGLLYADQGKIAGLMLGEETESILRTQASGDGVKTAEEYSAWASRPESIPQSGSERGTRFSITPAEDAAYLGAVKRGDMETAQRMVDEAAAKAGYATPHYFDAHSAPSPAYVDGDTAARREYDNASGTLGELKEMQTVAIRRTANSYAEARAALAPQVGKTFQNKESGITATLSNNSVNKLLSGKAVAKSVGVKAHLAAVANVTELFENGRLLETDDGTRKGVLSAKRFYSRFTHNGEDLVAKTTVLEYEHGDHRIYSVEAMEVKKAGSILAPKGSLNQAESPALPSTPPIVSHPGPSAQGGTAAGEAKYVNLPKSGSERTAESVARNSIRAALADGGAGEAERALANYVAYFKLSHGGTPSRKTLARMGLAMGMKTVMPDRIERSGRDMADRVRGTLIEQAARNGDVAAALALMRRENAVDQALDDLVAGGAAAGGAFTHKGVGRVNDIINRRVETMMKSFTAASLADMEGETGLDIASEILANDPDAFDPKPQKPNADPAATADEDEGGGAAADDAEDAEDRPLSDREKWERERLRKKAEEKVRKFIEEAKKRAEERRLKDEERRKRAEERRAQGLDPEEGGEGGGADFDPVAAELEAAKENAPKGTVLADFRSPSEFAAFLRVWAADRFARQHGHTSLAKAQQDRLFAEFYRICARKELGDLADKLLAPKGARAFVNRRLQDLEKGVRPDTVERISADVFGFINKAAIRETRDALVKKFKKDLRKRYLKGAKFDQMKQDADRKVTGWVEESVRYICRVCDLSRRALNGNPSAYERERAKLLEMINRREDVYDDAGRKIADAATADMETVHAMAKLALLDKYGAMKSLMPGQILDLQDEAFRYFEDEARKLEARWRETRERQDAIRIALAAAIVAPKGQRYQEKGWLNGRLFDALNGLIRLRLVHLTRFAPDEARRKAESAINDVLVMLGDGETAYARAIQSDRVAFFAGLAQIFQKPDGGADNAAIKKYLERMDEAIPEDLSRQLSKQGYVGTMTYGQMIQLLVSLEQGSFKNAVKANGRDGQSALIRGYRTVDGSGNAVNVFTREDGQFVDWLRTFYERKRGAISQVTMRMVGHEVLSPDPLYCPVRRSMDDRARGLHADPTPRWDPISKAFSRRVENLRDFDESRSIVGMFFESSEESAKLVAWAERGTIIRNVFTHVGVQNAIRRAFGASELGNILKQLEATFNGGKSRSTTPGEIAAADKAMNFITYSYLAFNPLSAMKQTTGFPVWANVLPNGFKDLWRHMTHVDKDVVKHIMESEQYKIRYGDEVGSGQDLATKGLYENPSTNPLVRAVSGAGMKMLKWGDFAPSVWIAQGVYKDLLDRYMSEGMDYDAADRRAMTETFNLLEETQQSGRTYNTNRMAIEHGRIARLLTQFATSPLQQLQFETQAWREWRDMVRYEMGEKKIAAARQKFWRAALINHILLPAALELVVSAYKLAMGEEPPWEKEGAHWDFLTEILLGQFSSVFFLGALTQTTLTALFKREQSSRGILPVEGAIGTLSSAAFLMHDLVAMDADNVRKDLERAIKSMAPTRIPYNVARRVLGDSDVDRKRKKEKRK